MSENAKNKEEEEQKREREKKNDRCNNIVTNYIMGVKGARHTRRNVEVHDGTVCMCRHENTRQCTSG